MKKSDGVTFRLYVSRKGEKQKNLILEKHASSVDPEPVSIDLAGYRGREVTIRLETHPGPAGSASYDWPLWTRPRIILQGTRLSSIGLVSPRPIVGLIPQAEGIECKLSQDTSYSLRLPVPGTTCVLFQQPELVELPMDLCKRPFHQALIFKGDEKETPPHGFYRCIPNAVAVGGVVREGLFAHPPVRGRNRIDWLLTLPDKPARLTGFAGLRDGAEKHSNGVGFRIVANDRTLWEKDLQPDGQWVPFDLPLADLKGQAVILSFITDSLINHHSDWAHWAEPKIITEEIP